MNSCPYNIPRKGPDGTLAKCDMCNDRVHNGLAPACVTICPTGCMNFGDRPDMIAFAKKRLKQVHKKYPKAMLLNPNEVNVIYLVALDPELYSESAVASANRDGMTRSAALRKMMGPFGRLLKV